MNTEQFKQKGYIYSKDSRRRWYIVVYHSVQELMLQCGEIPVADIIEVEVVGVKNNG